MNDRYATYLQSSAWIIKREKRLAIGGYRCSNCKSKNNLQVHHLTYERIFNEEPQDLLPLCDICHCLAEKLVRSGYVERQGNPIALAAKTLALLGSRPIPAKFQRKLKRREKRRKHRHHQRQQKRLTQPVFQKKRREPRRWHSAHAEIDSAMDRAILNSD